MQRYNPRRCWKVDAFINSPSTFKSRIVKNLKKESHLHEFFFLVRWTIVAVQKLSCAPSELEKASLWACYVLNHNYMYLKSARLSFRTITVPQSPMTVHWWKFHEFKTIRSTLKVIIAAIWKVPFVLSKILCLAMFGRQHTEIVNRTLKKDWTRASLCALRFWRRVACISRAQGYLSSVRGDTKSHKCALSSIWRVRNCNQWRQVQNRK